MKSSNIYIILIICAILFLILDYLLTTLHFKIENFSNIDEISPSISEDNNEQSNATLNKKNQSNNDTFEIKIDKFYPPPNTKASLQKLTQFTFKNNLFHQILPKFGGGYLGIIWHEPRLYGIYHSNTIINADWKLIDNHLPEGMKRPVFMSFDQDRKLLVIFEEANTFNVNKYHLYKKNEVDINSSLTNIEKSPIVSFIYDEDERMIGLDEKGDWYKKTSKDLSSPFKRIELGFTNIPMRRLLFDFRTKYIIGISKDFRVYKKRNTDWLNGEWDTINGPTEKTLKGSIKDAWFDSDGVMMGISPLGIVKQENAYYLSKFNFYKNQISENTVSLYKILYSSTGVNRFGNISNNNNTNNVYVDGKRISEYKFKDPRLQKYLKHRMDMKKKCRKIKALRIDQEEKNKQIEDSVRNDRFIRILNQQKDTIDNLMDSISYLRNK